MNYHQLPCGTVIPPEGIEAWVYTNGEFKKETIIGFVCSRVISVECGLLHFSERYSLTDPTKPKRRLVTPMELGDKWLHFKGDAPFYLLVIGFDGNGVYVKNSGYVIEKLPAYCKGYSDTPTSEVRSFWVEEV
jgi:hypothetical protein